MEKKELVIWDSICGSGKTQLMLEKLADKYGRYSYGNAVAREMYKLMPFIYITPYLSEVQRVKAFFKEHHIPVSEPEKGKAPSKLLHLKRLLSERRHIVCTHALLDWLDEDCLYYLNSLNYTIILDEVHEVIKQIPLKRVDCEMLTEKKLITIDKETFKVTWNNTVYKEYEGKFSDIKRYAELGSLYSHTEDMYLWLFPKSLFENANVYILTYLFEGQSMSSYLKLNEIEYKLKTLHNGEVVDWNEGYYKEDIAKIKPLINLYEGNLNFPPSFTFSYSWLNKICYNKDDEDKVKVIKANTYNYVRNIAKAKSGDIIWTTYKNCRKYLKGKGYSKPFLPINCRATNEYSDRNTVIFLASRYMNPIELTFYKMRKIDIDQDVYAISELIQFIWRSQIRAGKPINLYLPSQRMRELFKSYLEGEFR